MLSCRRTSFLHLFYCLTHSRPCCRIRGQRCSDPRQKEKSHWPDSMKCFVLLCVTQKCQQSVALKHSTQTGRAVVHIRILVLSLVSVFSGLRQEFRLSQEECRLFTTDYVNTLIRACHFIFKFKVCAGLFVSDVAFLLLIYGSNEKSLRLSAVQSTWSCSCFNQRKVSSFHFKHKLKAPLAGTEPVRLVHSVCNLFAAWERNSSGSAWMHTHSGLNNLGRCPVQ